MDPHPMMNISKAMKQHPVWIIDDSEIDVLVNKRLMELSEFSNDISVFHTAEEALHTLKEECPGKEDAPEWIFLDMNLAGMNGYEFIDAFSQLPDVILSNTKIIVLSVIQKQEQLIKVLTYPFVYAQLDKPLTKEALLRLKNN